MARLIGLLLMMVTAGLVADLAVQALQDPLTIGAAVAVALFPIGMLFGFLDSHRHWLWSGLAAVLVAYGLHRAVHPAAPEQGASPGIPIIPPPPLTPVHYAVPAVALLAGSQVGARAITRRVRAATQPANEAE